MISRALTTPSAEMLPSQRISEEEEVNYDWTTGNMKGISHDRLIGVGGFGEVHKVKHPLCLVEPLHADAQYANRRSIAHAMFI